MFRWVLVKEGREREEKKDVGLGSDLCHNVPYLKPRTLAHTQKQKPTTQAIGYYLLVPRGYVVLWHRCALSALLEEFIQLMFNRTRRWLINNQS